MKKILTLLLLLVTITSFGQVVDTLQAGEIVIKFFDTSTKIDTVERLTKITSRHGVVRGTANSIYFVSTSGDDANDGLSEATPWKTLDKVTWYGSSAGDIILLKRGDVWRERFVTPPGGESGNPVIIGAYGTGSNPVIDGADVINLTLAGGNVWQKTGVTVEPRVVYLNDTVVSPKDSIPALTSEGDWNWKDSIFSIYSTSDPSGNVEMGQRTMLINLANRDYVTLTNLTVQHANESSVMGGESWTGGGIYTTNGSNLKIMECIVQKNGLCGVTILNSSNITLDYNTFLNNGETNNNGGNVRVYADIAGTRDIVFTNNICSDSGQDGLMLHANLKTNHITNVNIHDNVFNNNDAAALYVQKLDTAVVYNNSFDSNGNGTTIHEDYSIGISSCDNLDVYNNMITNHVYNDAVQLYADERIDYGHANNVRIFNNYILGGVGYGDGISIATYDSANVENPYIFNNVIVGAEHNGINLWFDGDGLPDTAHIYNNVIYGSVQSGIRSNKNFPHILKNNIFYGNGEPDVLPFGSTSGLITSNNLYYRTSGNILEYNGTDYTSATITSFESSAQTGDPLFTDAANNNFSLQTGSPAINAGTDVGLTTDILGNPIVDAPDLGAYELQP